MLKHRHKGRLSGLGRFAFGVKLQFISAPLDNESAWSGKTDFSITIFLKLLDDMRRTKQYDREFAIPLVRNVFIRVGFDLKNRQVINFRIQLELHKNDEIRVIRRYDTAHGKPHVDKYDMPDPKTDEYEKIFFDINNIKDCMSSAINYLKENYVTIIERYLRRHRND